MADTFYDGGTPGTAFSTTAGVIDYTLPLGKVRLLILDTSPVEADWLFSDAQLNALLDLNDDSVYSTAAAALRTVALSEVLLAKKIRTQDLQTDGPAVAAELRAQAAVMDARAAAAQASHFEVVPAVDLYAEATERPWL